MTIATAASFCSYKSANTPHDLVFYPNLSCYLSLFRNILFIIGWKNIKKTKQSAKIKQFKIYQTGSRNS